ncbi:MAG: hypothetical protein K2L52_05380 [Clostridia bacterium]|nr:hypothetical protein [Clostridia bacterium]
MWWLALVFLLVILLESVVFVILYGIRISIRLDANNMSICIKCYVLDYIEMLCIKLFVCENKFYHQINKKPIKVIMTKSDEDKSNKKKKKLRKGAYVSNLWSKRPEITIQQLSVNYGVNSEDAKNRALLDGVIMLMSNTMMATNSNKLKITDFQLQNVSDEWRFNGIEASCAIGGLAIIKLFFYSIYAILIKGKYKIKV